MKENQMSVNSTDIPKGKPKSGRFWKGEKKTFNSMQQFKKAIRSKWSVKMQQKNDNKSTKLLEFELKNAKKMKIQEKIKRMEEKKKRKEENQKKSEVVQVIRNTAKIKRMSKKQLRRIKKADTSTKI